MSVQIARECSFSYLVRGSGTASPFIVLETAIGSRGQVAKELLPFIARYGSIGLATYSIRARTRHRAQHCKAKTFDKCCQGCSWMRALLVELLCSARSPSSSGNR